MPRLQAMLSLPLLWAAAGAALAGAAQAGATLTAEGPSRAQGARPPYSIEPAGCSGAAAVFYSPTEPLRSPPPLVVMHPGLAMPAAALHPYAHAFAGSGVAALVLEGPYSSPGASASARLPLLRRRARVQAAAECVRELSARGAADTSAVAFWGVEIGATFAVELGLATKDLDPEAVFVQVRRQSCPPPTLRCSCSARPRPCCSEAELRWCMERNAMCRMHTRTTASTALAQPCAHNTMLSSSLPQTPLLGGGRAHAWRLLTRGGWLGAARGLTTATADAAAALLGLPPLAEVRLAGPPGSGALLELGEHELQAHAAAVGAVFPRGRGPTTATSEVCAWAGSTLLNGAMFTPHRRARAARRMAASLLHVHTEQQLALWCCLTVRRAITPGLRQALGCHDMLSLLGWQAANHEPPTNAAVPAGTR